MITEDYVSFEIAKLLKERGFDEACWSWYHNGNNTHTGTSRYCNSELEKYDFSKATLAHVMKWLREVHNLFIDTYYDCDFGEGYRFSVHKLPKGTTLETHNENYSTYERACEAGIKYCLENLI